jgi:quinol monooxygenase YgiN
MIRVIAVLTAKPGRREALIDNFRANLAAVHAEAGCLEYQCVVDAEGPSAKYGPDVVVVIETWESAAALKAHSVSPHMVAFGEKTRELVADRAVHVLSPV